jgi:hypothetical protein
MLNKLECLLAAKNFQASLLIPSQTISSVEPDIKDAPLVQSHALLANIWQTLKTCK